MGFKVQATRQGYYGVLRDEGEIFLINAKEDYSAKWMAKVKKTAALSRQIGPIQDIRITHEAPKLPEVLADLADTSEGWEG